jgi:transposase InsO family protein
MVNSFFFKLNIGVENMSDPVHPIALFRLSVLGMLASRNNLQHGEIKKIVEDLAANTFQIPDTKRTHLSVQTILRWYYAYKARGLAGLTPKPRSDKGITQLSETIERALLEYKRDNQARSINTLISLVGNNGTKLARATVHRLLKRHNLSRRIPEDHQTIERRSFVAEHCGDIWQGDVLHGPSVSTQHGMRKTYLVSLMDDASRLLAHSEFCLGETALDIENVLKQAILKRGLPHKLIVDNGAAYRSHTLQAICARLEIRLIYCRPYEPEGKGKLERFHRTFRAQFLGELDLAKVTDLGDLNARLWAWIDQVYHVRSHQGLDDKSPIERWREDLIQVRQLGFKADKLEDIFCHRIERTVRKDGTISWEGRIYEVDFKHVDSKIILVIDPHTSKALRIESTEGEILGAVVLLDKTANLHRNRTRPISSQDTNAKSGDNMVELAYQEQVKKFTI